MDKTSRKYFTNNFEGYLRDVDSWMNERTILYRKWMEGIPAEWGTAVNVQAMVFGNMGDASLYGFASLVMLQHGQRIYSLANTQLRAQVKTCRGIHASIQICKNRFSTLGCPYRMAEEERASKYPIINGRSYAEIITKELDALQTKLKTTTT